MTIWATMLATAVALPQPAPAPAPASAPDVRVAAYLRSGLTVHIAPSQTIGGLGGGPGIRFSFPKRWFVQADLSYLGLIGNAGELRFGGGVQRSGLWTPSAIATISMLFGERFSFRTAEHPWPSSGPVITGGISLAPLRFTKDNRTVSLFELGVGIKPDFPGVGLTYSVGILEIGHTF